MNPEVVIEFLGKMKQLSPEGRAEIIKYLEDLVNSQERAYPAAAVLGKKVMQ